MHGPNDSTACPILLVDSHVLVVDKPAGWLSHPNPGKSSATVPVAFHGPYDPKDRRFDGPGGPVWLIHRLDQDTSGVLLAARDAETANRLRQSFDNGLVKKHYLAVVAGRAAARGVWKDALAMRRGDGKVRASVAPGAPLNAELHFTRCSYSPAMRMSVLRTELVTGRTHQIRVQAASRQHPVLGDDVYGDFGLNRWARKELGLRRLFLHAACLEFPHPAAAHPLRVEAPLPPELQDVLAKLGLTAG